MWGFSEEPFMAAFHFNYVETKVDPSDHQLEEGIQGAHMT